MKGKDLLLGLKYIGDDLINEAETAMPSFQTERKKPRRNFRRPLLIAALIAMMLMLVGCGVAVLMKMQDVKIAESTETLEYSWKEGKLVNDPHTVNTNVLSLSGLKGSKTYQACADFYTFREAYSAEIDQKERDGTLPEGFWDSGEYTNTIEAKAQELAQQYGLTPEGEKLDFRTTRNLCDALGVERFVRDGQPVSTDVKGGVCRENGNFYLDIQFRFPEGQGYALEHTSGRLLWNWQDCFSRDYVTIEESGDWVEKNYTTASGQEVLILHSPSHGNGYILCNRGNAMMSVSLAVNHEMLTDEGGVAAVQTQSLTEKQIEMIADSLDFAVNPRIPTKADVDAQPAPSQEMTQNGYTVSVKSVETDGYSARIRIGIAAPEGVSLPTEQGVRFSNTMDMLVSSTNPGFGSFSIGTVDDGDGKANTLDLMIQCSADPVDGQPPYAKGSTWNLHLIDIIYVTVPQNGGYPVETTLAEGEWNIPITFGDNNGNYQELELITQPIQAKACTGYSADGGGDYVETFTITSFVLREKGFEIQSDAPDYADFCWINGNPAKVVLKDGTEIKLGSAELSIDLSQVDHVILADGTKLPVPQE